MPPIPHHWVLVRGDDASRPLTVYEPAAPATPYDLTAATLAFTAATEPGGTVLWEKAGGSGIVVGDADAGELTVSIAASDWDDVAASCEDIHWDLQATRFALVTTLARGTIRVVPDVTR